MISLVSVCGVQSCLRVIATRVCGGLGGSFGNQGLGKAPWGGCVAAIMAVWRPLQLALASVRAHLYVRAFVLLVFIFGNHLVFFFLRIYLFI